MGSIALWYPSIVGRSSRISDSSAFRKARLAASNASFMQPHLRHLRSAIPRSISCNAGAARLGRAVLIDDICNLPFAIELPESYDASASCPHLQPLFEPPCVSVQLLIGTNCRQFGENR